MKTEMQVKPVDALKNILEAPSVRKQFENALGDARNLFIASLIDLFSGDKYLQECNPNAVVMEALKAATLKLPINKSLGFAYIVAYKKVPAFQLGYRGMIQLAMRSGVYKYLNADVVFEGEYQGSDKLTGAVDLTGKATGGPVIGYFAYLETLNGFKKTIYWSVDKVVEHAKKFSQSYGRNGSAWQTNFDEMAKKTVLRALLSKYGLFTIEMADGFHAEEDEPADTEYRQTANSDVIDVDPEPTPANVNPETGEVTGEAPKDDGPGY
jgi:recombination protein RecT